MSNQIIGILMVSLMVVFLVIIGQIMDYCRSPLCKWCQSRHRGRCIFNPRSGKLFANTSDGYFDYNDPNK